MPADNIKLSLVTAKKGGVKHIVSVVDRVLEGSSGGRNANVFIEGPRDLGTLEAQPGDQKAIKADPDL